MNSQRLYTGRSASGHGYCYCVISNVLMVITFKVARGNLTLIAREERSREDTKVT